VDRGCPVPAQQVQTRGLGILRYRAEDLGPNRESRGGFRAHYGRQPVGTWPSRKRRSRVLPVGASRGAERRTPSAVSARRKFYGAVVLDPGCRCQYGWPSGPRGLRKQKRLRMQKDHPCVNAPVRNYDDPGGYAADPTDGNLMRSRAGWGQRRSSGGVLHVDPLGASVREGDCPSRGGVDAAGARAPVGPARLQRLARLDRHLPQMASYDSSSSSCEFKFALHACACRSQLSATMCSMPNRRPLTLNAMGFVHASC